MPAADSLDCYIDTFIKHLSGILSLEIVPACANAIPATTAPIEGAAYNILKNSIINIELI